MKLKALIAVSVMCACVSTQGASEEKLKFLGFQGNDKGNMSWSGLELVGGVCSYAEGSERLDNISGTRLAEYVQVPVVVAGKTKMNFGVVFASFDMRRTRPEFSLSHDCGGYLGLPAWMPLEIGAYAAMSPWMAWGGQVGLLSLKF